MRCYVNQVSSELHDIRGKEFSLYHQEDYQAPQTFAATMRTEGCKLTIKFILTNTIWSVI
jgi:hypothetical protein